MSCGNIQERDGERGMRKLPWQQHVGSGEQGIVGLHMQCGIHGTAIALSSVCCGGVQGGAWIGIMCKLPWQQHVGSGEQFRIVLYVQNGIHRA